MGRQPRTPLGDVYVWESVLPIPGDSRHETIMCGVDWFWNSVRPNRLPPILPRSMVEAGVR